MKLIIVSILMIFSSIGLADNDQYKDLTRKNTNMNGISPAVIRKAQLDFARRKVIRDERILQKEEENLKSDRADLIRLKKDFKDDGN